MKKYFLNILLLLLFGYLQILAQETPEIVNSILQDSSNLDGDALYFRDPIGYTPIKWTAS